MTATAAASTRPAPARGSRPGHARRPRTVRARIAVTLKYLSLLAMSVVVLLPLVVLFTTSLKTAQEVRTSGALDAPASWLNFANYATAFSDGRMLMGFTNTTIILIVSVTATVFLGSMTGFALDRFDFRFKKVVVALFLLATLVPAVTTQVATFQVVNFLGLFDTRLSAILLYMGTDIISIYIFLQFVRGIPVALDEAARIDGASTFGVYWRIVLPNLKPAIATVVIVKGIFVYNDFFIPFLYMPSDDLGTASTALFRFKGPFGADWGAISAGAVIVIVPSLIAFLLLQRFIYNGFGSGAVK